MSGAGECADWRAIATLKARYCRLLDEKDWEGFAALFTDDVVIDTTASGGPRFEGVAQAVGSIRRSLETARTVHHVHMPEIEIDGDMARGVWAMQDRLIWENGRTLTGYGHYRERYARGAAGWRIAESRLTRLIVELAQPDA